MSAPDPPGTGLLASRPRRCLDLGEERVVDRRAQAPRTSRAKRASSRGEAVLRSRGIPAESTPFDRGRPEDARSPRPTGRTRTPRIRSRLGPPPRRAPPAEARAATRARARILRIDRRPDPRTKVRRWIPAHPARPLRSTSSNPVRIVLSCPGLLHCGTVRGGALTFASGAGSSVPPVGRAPGRASRAPPPSIARGSPRSPPSSGPRRSAATARIARPRPGPGRRSTRDSRAPRSREIRSRVRVDRTPSRTAPFPIELRGERPARRRQAPASVKSHVEKVQRSS
jgi:hypothetical protein